jgi:hypothetical protein
MCHFLSAIVLRNGDVLTHSILDSRSDLVRYFKLPDTNEHIQHFAKVGLTPANDTWTDASKWTWRVDEEVLPSWWDDVATSAEATLRARAQRMILTEGEHDLIADGCWIVAGTAKIRDVRSGRIMRVQDKATISDVWGGTISGVWGGTISDVWGGAMLDASAKAHVAVKGRSK